MSHHWALDSWHLVRVGQSLSCEQAGRQAACGAPLALIKGMQATSGRPLHLAAAPIAPPTVQVDMQKAEDGWPMAEKLTQIPPEAAQAALVFVSVQAAEQ